MLLTLFVIPVLYRIFAPKALRETIATTKNAPESLTELLQS